MPGVSWVHRLRMGKIFPPPSPEPSSVDPHPTPRCMHVLRGSSFAFPLPSSPGWTSWALEMPCCSGKGGVPILGSVWRKGRHPGLLLCLCVSPLIRFTLWIHWGQRSCHPGAVLYCVSLSLLPQISGLQGLVLSWVTFLHFWSLCRGILPLWLLSVHVYLSICLHAVYIRVSLGFNGPNPTEERPLYLGAVSPVPPPLSPPQGPM